MAKSKKRNPQDTTFRNINALKSAIQVLGLKVVGSQAAIEEILARQAKMEERLQALETNWNR